jgi:hypothetical protein
MAKRGVRMIQESFDLSQISGPNPRGCVPEIVRLMRKRMIIRRYFFKAPLILFLAFHGILGGVVGLHWGLNVCPFEFSTFEDSEVMPIIYGYPTTELVLRALNGEIFLGGCIVRSLSGLCPYCHWPARFSFFGPSQSQDEKDEEEPVIDPLPEGLERI